MLEPLKQREKQATTSLHLREQPTRPSSSPEPGRPEPRNPGRITGRENTPNREADFPVASNCMLFVQRLSSVFISPSGNSDDGSEATHVI